MNSARKYFSRWRISAVTGFVLFTATACNFGPSAKSRDAEKPAAAAKNANGPEIDLNCVPDHLQNPPEAFENAGGGRKRPVPKDNRKPQSQRKRDRNQRREKDRADDVG